MDLLTSVLELVVVGAVLGALVAAAVIVGWPWSLPVGLVAVAGAAAACRAAVAARTNLTAPRGARR